MLNPLKGMRLDEETAYQYAIQLLEAVEKVGGVFTMLWHPNGILISHWWNLYLRILQMLTVKNTWLGSVRQIGEIFKNQKKQSVSN